jgi:hypothetical protein
MSLTAIKALEVIGQMYQEDTTTDGWRQALVLHGLSSHLLKLDRSEDVRTDFGQPNERFEFVNYDKHPILGEPIQDDLDHVEQGDAIATLNRLVDKSHPWNIKKRLHDIQYNHRFEIGEVVRFWGKDGEFYVMPIATNLWHFQHMQESILFKRVKFAEVYLYDAKADDDYFLVPFIGTQEACIEFAKRLDPNLHVASEQELMGNQGALPMPDGSKPMIGELGKLGIIVHGYTFD